MNLIQKSLSFWLILLGFFTIGHAQDNSPRFGPARGSLMIVGGGSVGADIWARFIELAGGESASIVVIPTANEDVNISGGTSAEKELLQHLGVKNVTVLHTRDRKQADDPNFVAPLRKATGIWFTGGRHWRLADSYLNTLAHREFKALLERGGVIAGTSAGATIQGSFMVRGDTKGNTLMIGDHTEGLGFIQNVTIDQHLLVRNRQFDLVEVIRQKPELLGIGIDESTAIVVQKDTFEVIGNSFVAIYDAKNILGNANQANGSAQVANRPFYFLNRGQRFNLKEKIVLRR
ncbi:cyanophycinase [Haliscomenobacter sp.]|uniref:cyanophycinase n=1 Tax=Haliscomenobacter sp. TaxID=2717303 RepID=UPI003BABECE1